MSKYTVDDIKILDEGHQIRNAIEKKHGGIRNFYNSNKMSLSFNSFKTYLSRSKIHSDTFKYTITRLLDEDYNKIVKNEKEQIRDFVHSIYNNIKLYRDEDDFNTIEALFKLCKQNKMSLEAAMMYRAKARNYYYRNKMNHAVEFYEYAINSLPENEINKLAFFHCELAYLYYLEVMTSKAEDHFRIAEKCIEAHKLDDETIFYFHYWKGIMLLNTENIISARESFEEAGKYAAFDYEKGAAVQNIGLTYKKEQNYEAALKYYYEALNYYNKSDTSRRISVLNNLAEVYRAVGDYDNAIYHINNVLLLSENNNTFEKYFLYTITHTEIELLRGNYEACTKYFDALKNTKYKQIDKTVIINGISNIIKIIDNKDILKQFLKIIIELKNSSDNREYIEDLYKYLGLIYEKINKLGGEIV